MTTVRLSFYVGIIASVSLFFVNLAAGTLALKLTAAGWIGTILFSIAVSGIAVLLYQYGVQLIGPQNASLFATFEPLTSILVGGLLLKESLTARSALGIAAILLSVFLLALAEQRKSRDLAAQKNEL